MSGLHHAELRPRSLRYCTPQTPQRLCRNQTRRQGIVSVQTKTLKGRIHLRVAVGRCPLWVISGHLQCKTACPLCPRKGIYGEAKCELCP